jgi:hypothetical protein
MGEPTRALAPEGSTRRDEYGSADENHAGGRR